MVIDNDTYINESQRFFHLLIEEYNHMHCNENDIDNNIKALFKYLIKEKEDKITFLYLQERFTLSNIILFAVMLSFFYEIDSKVRNFIYTTFKTDVPTFYEVFVLYQYVEDIHFSDIIKLVPNNILKMLFKLNRNEDSLLEQSIILQNYVLKFLSDEILIPSEGIIIYNRKSETLPILQDELNSLRSILQRENHLVLKGRKESGKSELLNQLMNEGIQYLVVDWNYIEALPFHFQEQNLLEICFFAILEEYVVVFQDEEESSFKNFVYYSKRMNQLHIPWILNTNSNEAVFNFARVIEIPSFLKEIDMEKLVESWKMNEEILEYQYSFQNLLDMKNGVYKVENQKKSPYTQKVFYNINLQDFLCEKSILELVQSMLYQIKNRRNIQKKLRIKSAKRGIQIVFHGPSGTGKTMLASIIANELNLSLYRVNLAMINDKYIGESEKHLEEIFTMAEQENCILLFDEADVLFSKRVQVNSSNDRHANSATAFLLQRLESYQGIVILTSNLIHNFDDAFLRRMRFIIRLGKPNKAMQKKKWKKLLHQISLPNEIDVDEVNAWDDITLAAIENIVYFSVAKALEEKSEVLKMKHLYKAYQIEMQKEGKLIKFSI